MKRESDIRHALFMGVLKIGLVYVSVMTCFSSPLSCCLCLLGAQEDQRRLRHGTGFPSVPGPAGLHAWPHLPR